MKKIYLSIILIFIMGITPLTAQEEAKANKIEQDKDYENYKDELYLTDTDYFKKYIEKFEGADTQFLYKSYTSMTDPMTKIYILRLAVKKGFSDQFVFKIFELAIEEAVTDPSITRPKRQTDSWKVRAAAAYLIHDNPTGIDEKIKREFVRRLIRTMKTDPEERCRAMAVLAIGKMYEGDSEGGAESDQKYKRYNLLSKDVIIEILNTQLETTSNQYQFYCWANVKALGYLKSPKSFFVLLQTRKRGFNHMVKLEISRSLDAITGGGGGSAPTP